MRYVAWGLWYGPAGCGWNCGGEPLFQKILEPRRRGVEEGEGEEGKEAGARLLTSAPTSVRDSVVACHLWSSPAGAGPGCMG